jgi:aryl-alcohol dehydrogenase-like predicted oxidoreductase
MSTRRDFLRAATAAAVLSPALSRGESDKLGAMLPRRLLGATGEKVTALGLGGHHVGGSKDENTVRTLIERAIERGIRFFDNAANYQSGLAETLYGKFLTPKFRDHVFITTKSTATTAAAARKDLENSLRRLNTGHLDLWLIHSLQSVEDVEKRIANGVIDVFLEAREKKLARFIGFTGHASQRAHCHFIDWCARRGICMDACQMPVNLFDSHYDSFLVHVEPKLREHRIALLAMKTMVFGRVFEHAAEIPEGVLAPENLHGFAYSLPVACLVSGCETVQQIDQNAAILENHQPMDEKRRAELIAAVKSISGPQLEYYKRKA